MKRSLILALAVVTVAGLSTGCRARVRVRAPNATVHVQPPPPPSGSVAVSVGTPAVSAGAGVTVIQAACQPGAAEVCNGLDDNCNGVIDEGCGYQTGQIQITLAWATGADLDMYVTDPMGQTISYMNRQSGSGGVLDHDARGACNASQANNTIENVYWNSPRPPSGQYQVEVHYWGDCGAAGITPATLSIAVGGQIIGAYNVTLQPRERQTVAVFTMP